MEAKFFIDIRDSLSQKIQILTQWLKSASVEEKQRSLGPASEHSVQDHLKTIDQTVEMAENQTDEPI